MSKLAVAVDVTPNLKFLATPFTIQGDTHAETFLPALFSAIFALAELCFGLNEKSPYLRLSKTVFYRPDKLCKYYGTRNKVKLCVCTMAGEILSTCSTHNTSAHFHHQCQMTLCYKAAIQLPVYHIPLAVCGAYMCAHMAVIVTGQQIILYDPVC